MDGFEASADQATKLFLPTLISLYLTRCDRIRQSHVVFFLDNINLNWYYISWTGICRFVVECLCFASAATATAPLFHNADIIIMLYVTIILIQLSLRLHRRTLLTVPHSILIRLVPLTLFYLSFCSLKNHLLIEASHQLILSSIQLDLWLV